MSKILEQIIAGKRSVESFAPAPPSKELEEFSKKYRNAVKRSEKAFKTEKRKFGGHPLPWEPGGKEYFEEIAKGWRW